MSALKQILKSKSFSSLIGNGLGALLGVLTFALLARFLPKDIFGPWLVFLAVYGIFDTLRIGMVMNALVKNLAQAHNEAEETLVVGSSLFITLLLTAIYIVVITVLYFIFKALNIFPDYLFFFKWFVIMAVVTAPNNFATWYLNAKLKIVAMSLIRIVSQLIFIGYAWFVIKDNPNIHEVFKGYALSHLVVSLLALAAGWSGVQHLLKYTKAYLLKIFHFGKYSMGTLIGSNLLRSSDTFIIGSSVLGAAGVALFNVPTRIIEIIEMPLRSFAVTALPQFARLYADNDISKLRIEFERKAGLVFFLLLPVSLGSFIFADYIVLVMGGSGYAGSAVLLRFFASYMAILPLDKFSGVMLDTINRPNLNFYKVMIMLAVNVIGDYVCILVFGNLQSVAIVSTATFLAGMIFGYRQLHREIGVSFKNVIRVGWVEFKGRIKQILNRKTIET